MPDSANSSISRWLAVMQASVAAIEGLRAEMRTYTTNSDAANRRLEEIERQLTRLADAAQREAVVAEHADARAEAREDASAKAKLFEEETTAAQRRHTEETQAMKELKILDLVQRAFTTGVESARSLLRIDAVRVPIVLGLGALSLAGVQYVLAHLGVQHVEVLPELPRPASEP